MSCKEFQSHFKTTDLRLEFQISKFLSPMSSICNPLHFIDSQFLWTSISLNYPEFKHFPWYLSLQLSIEFSKKKVNQTFQPYLFWSGVLNNPIHHFPEIVFENFFLMGIEGLLFFALVLRSLILFSISYEFTKFD